MATRQQFALGGFLIGVGLAAGAACGILLLKQCSLLLQERAWLPWTEVAAILALCLLTGVWFGWASNRGLAREGVRFLRRLRRRQWVEIFGFACYTAFAGVLLGIGLSFPKWFYLDGRDAWLHMICLSGAAAVVGFWGGFGAQFTHLSRR